MDSEEVCWCIPAMEQLVLHACPRLLTGIAGWRSNLSSACHFYCRISESAVLGAQKGSPAVPRGAIYNQASCQRPTLPSGLASKRYAAAPAKHLQKIVNKLDRRLLPLQDLQMLALLTLGFRGFFRWSDLSALRVEDIHVSDGFLSAFLAKP